MQEINTEKAPKALGSYSQAVSIGGQIFCSGQIGLNPVSGELSNGGVVAETEQIFANLQAVLEQAGVGYDDVAHVQIYLTNIDDFASVNEIYSKIFINKPYPARVTVAVTALPKGASIEVSCIAIKK